MLSEQWLFSRTSIHELVNGVQAWITLSRRSLWRFKIKCWWSMNFLLKQQKQQEKLPRHQPRCSQQRLGKAGPRPPGWEDVRSGILCCSLGWTSEVAVSMQSFPPCFPLEVRVQPPFLVSAFQPMPSFSKVVTNRRRIHYPCSRWSFREVPPSICHALLPLMASPSCCLGTSLHQWWDLTGLTVAPQDMKQSQILIPLRGHAPRVPAGASMPIRMCEEGQRGSQPAPPHHWSPGKRSTWELPCALNFSKTKALRYHLKR